MHTTGRSGENANTIADVTNSNCTTMLSVIHEITCHLLIYAAPGATPRNWREKSRSSNNVTSAKSCGNAVPTPLHPWIRACVSRYDQFAWTADKCRSSKRSTYCKHRCATVLPQKTKRETSDAS